MTGEKEAMGKGNDMEKHKSDSLPAIDESIWGRRMLVPSWHKERKLGYGTTSQLGETGGT